MIIDANKKIQKINVFDEMMNTQIGRNWSYFQIILLAVNIFMKVNTALWVGALKISLTTVSYIQEFILPRTQYRYS